MSSDKKLVAVLDYGSGNVHSAVKALKKAGADAVLTADKTQIAAADGLFVPGVGAFDAVMRQLESVDAKSIIAATLTAKKPVLGVCVGLQVLFESGSERGISTAGLKYFTGSVHKLDFKRSPHMGWNTVLADSDSVLLRGVNDQQVYFVHSYGVTEQPQVRDCLAGGDPLGAAAPVVSWSAHDGVKFIAAIEAGLLSAVQFHPEKSGDAGLKILTNWISGL